MRHWYCFSSVIVSSGINFVEVSGLALFCDNGLTGETKHSAKYIVESTCFGCIVIHFEM